MGFNDLPSEAECVASLKDIMTRLEKEIPHSGGWETPVAESQERQHCWQAFKMLPYYYYFLWGGGIILLQVTETWVILE